MFEEAEIGNFNLLIMHELTSCACAYNTKCLSAFTTLQPKPLLNKKLNVINYCKKCCCVSLDLLVILLLCITNLRLYGTHFYLHNTLKIEGSTYCWLAEWGVERLGGSSIDAYGTARVSAREIFGATLIFGVILCT